MTAREVLAAAKKRADAAARNRERYGSGTTQAVSATDVPVLVAALTAVLDLIDRERGLIEHHPDDLDGVGGVAVLALCDDITATIEHHLTGDTL